MIVKSFNIRIGLCPCRYMCLGSCWFSSACVYIFNGFVSLFQKCDSNDNFVFLHAQLQPYKEQTKHEKEDKSENNQGKERKKGIFHKNGMKLIVSTQTPLLLSSFHNLILCLLSNSTCNHLISKFPPYYFIATHLHEHLDAPQGLNT